MIRITLYRFSDNNKPFILEGIRIPLIRIVLIIMLSSIHVTAFSQKKWKQIVLKSNVVYKAFEKGKVVIYGRYKNALKDDTSNFIQTFTFLKSPEPIGKLTYKDNLGFSIYKDLNTYFIYTNSRRYYNSSKKPLQELEFLPHWDPDNFFKQLLKTGSGGKVNHHVDEIKNHYIIRIKNRNLKSEIIIDATNYMVIKYTETIKDRKYGEQYKEYLFLDSTNSVEPDFINKELAMIINNFQAVTDESLKIGWKENDKRILELINTRIDRTILDSLISQNDATSNKYDFLLLDFFYQMCIPCIKSVSDLNDLNSAFRYRNKLLIIGVDPVPEDDGHKNNFIKRYNLTYPVVEGKEARLIKDHYFEKLQIIYPTMVLINSEGVIKKIFTGYSVEHFRELNHYLRNTNY